MWRVVEAFKLAALIAAFLLGWWLTPGDAATCDNDGHCVEQHRATHAARRHGWRELPSNIRALTVNAAAQAGVPERIAIRVVQVESGGRPHLRGAAGEYGLTQIKCATARGLGFRGSCSALLDAGTNLRWGLLHVRKALDRGSVGFHQAGLYARHVSPAYMAYYRGAL